MKQRRVVITGIGIVAPNGTGKAEFWRNLVAGKSGVDRVFAFDASSYPCHVAGEVHDFSPSDFVSPHRAKTMGRFSQFAVAATRLAMDDAKLTITSAISEKIGIAWGTSSSAVGDIGAEALRGFAANGLMDVSPSVAVEYPPHAAAIHLATEFKAYGPAVSVSTNCCTGLDAVYAGYTQIMLGKAKVSLAGGSDAPIFPEVFGAFCRYGALTGWKGDPPKASRPYDRLRDGIVLAEGGATLILEELEFALARGARIYAEILGHGSANAGLRLGRRDAEGTMTVRAIEIALDEASLASSDIDHVNAHGSAIPAFDVRETKAFKRVFGDRAYNIPITSIKSMIGQPISAAGVMQTATACLSIAQQIVPPTINQDERDPECDLDYVPNVARTADVTNVLINGQGFGGGCTALVIGRRAATDPDVTR